MAGRQLATVIREILGRMAVKNGSGLTDDALLQRFIGQADEAAFETLMWRHGPMVLAACRHMLANSHDAEDAFQGTFLVLARKAASIQKRISLSSWLYKVAYRICRHAQAQADRHPRHAGAALEVEAPDFASDALCQEFLPILDEELHRLGEKHRAVLILHYLEGKRVEQVAHELSLPQGTVASRLARAKAILRSRLTRRGVALSTGLVASVLSTGVEATVLPGAVVHNTLLTARLFTAGVTLAGRTSTRAACLAEAVLKSMLVSKVKAAVVLVMASLLATGTGVVAYQISTERQPTAEQREAAAVPAQQAEKPASEKQEHRPADLADDPLPEGAIARLGSMRFRHGHSVSSLTFLPEGKCLLASDWSGIYIWDAKTGRQLRRIGQDFQTSLRSCSLSADGKRLATTEHHGHTIQVWDVQSGKLVLSFSQNGKELYAWGDKKVQAWDSETGKKTKDLFAGHEDRSYAAAFAPNGKWVAVGGQEAVVILYDLGTGKEFKRLTGLPGATSALAFSADSRTLAWGGWYGGPVVLWEIATNQQRRCFSGHLGRIHSLVFSPSGKFLASGSDDTTALLWDVVGRSSGKGRIKHRNLLCYWFHLDVELRRGVGKVAKKSRAQPAFHVLFLPTIDVAAAVCSRPFQNDLGIREVAGRKDRQEPLLGVRDVSGRHIDHRVGTADERLLDQSHVGIIKDPQTLPLVRLDDEDRVVHGESSSFPKRTRFILRRFARTILHGFREPIRS